MAQQESDSRSKAMERLRSETRGLADALGDRALASIRKRVEGAADRLTDYVEGGAGPGLIAAVTGARGLAEGKSPGRSMLGAGMSFMREKITGASGGRGKGGQRKLKLTNIVESIDVGVPVRVAYNQWTEYSDFPKFTKKVDSVDQNKEEENKTNWQAQVFWSHRTWEATVIEQVPDERIIWRSTGQKGHVDGAVTFHGLAPNLTRILLVMEYHPQGMFEHTGNLWRAQGRRARLELKHFRRHMMMEGILHADELEGWRGTIHDSEVAESHEDAVSREQKDGAQQEESRQSGDARVEDMPEDRAEGGEEARGEREESEQDEDQGEESADRRAARARTASAGRSRRSSETRSSGAAGDNARRQRAVPGSVRRHVSAYERVWRGTGVMEPLHARQVQASSIVAGGTREGAIPAG